VSWTYRICDEIFDKMDKNYKRKRNQNLVAEEKDGGVRVIRDTNTGGEISDEELRKAIAQNYM